MWPTMVWLAEVVAHGMVRPSFVPPPPIQEQRELTRYRKTRVDARAREIQRLEKVLQDACVKLTSVASTVWSKSSRADDRSVNRRGTGPAVLADMAKGRMRPKIAVLTDALAANWRPHHSIVAARIIAHIDFLDATIEESRWQIGERNDPFAELIGRMVEVPGVDTEIAEIVIAETGGDMTRFPTGAAVRLGRGLHRAVTSRPANDDLWAPAQVARWLRRALIEAAKSASTIQ